MKKAFDQTVRDIKREVNKKVLKVPGIEQKTLDATNNEDWIPHGILLTDLAQATQNYHEYQMVMNVIWKRINDTGKNWRHVYKALIVLEYLVAYGSERVVDEIREHAFQTTMLVNFQYMDSGGKDKGHIVRTKSRSLISLVNDNEKIELLRKKALANNDKHCGAFSTGGAYSSGGYGDRYDEGRYSTRGVDRNGYGRERDFGPGDADKYGKYRDSCGQVGDQNSRDGDKYRDDEYRGGCGKEDCQFGLGNKSLDTNKDHYFEDDARSPPRQVELKPYEKSLDEPPIREEATRLERNERSGLAAETRVPEASSLLVPKVSSPSNWDQDQGCKISPASMMPTNGDDDGFDNFDPRGSFSAAPPTESRPTTEFFAPLSDPFSSTDLVPVATSDLAFDSLGPTTSGFAVNFDAPSTVSDGSNEAAENPFGYSPFRAVPESSSFPTQQQSYAPTAAAPGLAEPSFEAENGAYFGFGEPSTDSFGELTFTPSNTSGQYSGPGTSFLPLDATAAHGAIPSAPTQPAPSIVQASHMSSLPESRPLTPLASHSMVAPNLQAGQAIFLAPSWQPGTLAFQAESPNVHASHASFLQQSWHPGLMASQAAPNAQPPQMSFLSQVGQLAPLAYQAPPPPSSHFHAQSVAAASASDSNRPSSFLPLMAPSALLASDSVSVTSAIPPAKAEPPKEKFATKSTVWSDTLSRGLVNLDISGPKVNNLADIGIDFDSINRVEKTKAKSSATPAASAVVMGRAMGAGSGMGRAGMSGSSAPTPVPLMGSSVAMGMGMGMSMGLGQGVSMRPEARVARFDPGVGYNPAMGSGGYSLQQPGYNPAMGQGVSMRPEAGVAGFDPGVGYSLQHSYGGGYN